MEFPGSMHGHRVWSLWVCILGVFRYEIVWVRWVLSGRRKRRGGHASIGYGYFCA